RHAGRPSVRRISVFGCPPSATHTPSVRGRTEVTGGGEGALAAPSGEPSFLPPSFPPSRRPPSAEPSCAKTPSRSPPSISDEGVLQAGPAAPAPRAPSAKARKEQTNRSVAEDRPGAVTGRDSAPNAELWLEQLAKKTGVATFRLDVPLRDR